MLDTKNKLLDAAAKCVQTQGYNGFSYHDLSAAVGVKTASIHYHFPTKSDLAVALAKRYTDNFMTALGDADEGTPKSCLARYVSLFRAALHDGRMCLCGMIGAEVQGIPDVVAAEARGFFAANEKWLTQVIERTGTSKKLALTRARTLVATLEGAMLVSRTSANPAQFDEVAHVALNHALGQFG
jgi:TetR/AcrR family transcriptional regulator, transcriptional repressor for nem operon